MSWPLLLRIAVSQLFRAVRRPWFSSVRQKLTDPAYSSWFIPFKPGGYFPNGTWHVPACDDNYDPPLCSEFCERCIARLLFAVCGVAGLRMPNLQTTLRIKHRVTHQVTVIAWRNVTAVEFPVDHVGLSYTAAKALRKEDLSLAQICLITVTSPFDRGSSTNFSSDRVAWEIRTSPGFTL